MNNIKKNELYELKDFLILWSTQSVSQLGSSITAFALTLWLYETVSYTHLTLPNDLLCVDLGGRSIIKKKQTEKKKQRSGQ